LPTHLDMGLIAAPGVVRGVELGADPLLEIGSVALDVSGRWWCGQQARRARPSFPQGRDRSSRIVSTSAGTRR
jgi:hypothetical protein